MSKPSKRRRLAEAERELATLRAAAAGTAARDAQVLASMYEEVRRYAPKIGVPIRQAHTIEQVPSVVRDLLASHRGVS